MRLAPQLVSLRLNADASLFSRTASPRRTRRGTATSQTHSALGRGASAGTASARSSSATSTTSARRSALVGLHRSLAGPSAELVSKRGATRQHRATRGQLARHLRAFRVPEGCTKRPCSTGHALDRGPALGRLAYTWSMPASRSTGAGDPVRRLVGERPGGTGALRARARDGAEPLPVKDSADLEAAQEQIAAICRERLALDVRPG